MSDDLTQHTADGKATFKALPGIKRVCAYAGEGRFEVNEKNGKDGKTRQHGVFTA